MKKREEEKEIDNLINEFFASLELGDENEVLKEYITRHPEHAQVFFEAASYERMVKEMPKQEYSKEQEDTLNLRAQSVVQNLLYKYLQDNSVAQAATEKVDEIAPLVDLKGEIQRKGFTIKSFARAAGLSETIIEAFHTREVLFASIKRKAIENVATTLGYPFEIIKNYFLLGAMPEPSHLKADETPRFSSQMDFSELVATDPDMTENEKKYWLDQES
jgi:transcriptional regulator with XRE-family HTH domain